LGFSAGETERIRIDLPRKENNSSIRPRERGLFFSRRRGQLARKGKKSGEGYMGGGVLKRSSCEEKKKKRGKAVATRSILFDRQRGGISALIGV